MPFHNIIFVVLFHSLVISTLNDTILSKGDPSLEQEKPKIQWYGEQIAGHNPEFKPNNIGFIKMSSEPKSVFKHIQSEGRGDREISIYSLCQLIPQFYGVQEINPPGKKYTEKFLQLEDIVYPFSKPCVMDIKMGKKTYTPWAKEDKIKREESRSTLTGTNGITLVGFKVQNDIGITVKRDRKWGYARNENDIKQALKEFLFSARPNMEENKLMLELFIAKLNMIKDWFDRQRILHFYSSSLLFVYEGDNEKPPKIDVRMIDFGHVYPADNQKEDHNYLSGLNNLIGLMEEIHDEH